MWTMSDDDDFVETSPLVGQEEPSSSTQQKAPSSASSGLPVSSELTFRLGDQFSSFTELKEKITAYSSAHFVQLWKRDARTIESAKNASREDSQQDVGRAEISQRQVLLRSRREKVHDKSVDTNFFVSKQVFITLPRITLSHIASASLALHLFIRFKRVRQIPCNFLRVRGNVQPLFDSFFTRTEPALNLH